VTAARAGAERWHPSTAEQSRPGSLLGGVAALQDDDRAPGDLKGLGAF